jgi:DNA-binding CsgD family transcriptional regulator
MTTEWQRARARERLVRLASSDAGLHELRLEAVALLKRMIGFERWCWSISDPDSLLAGGDLAEADLWPVMPRMFLLEQRDTVHAAHLLARRPSPVGALSKDTAGDLARSPAWDECLRPFGVGDQATVVMRDAHGSWGYLKAWRNSDERAFAPEDLQLLHDVAPALGSALRRRAIDPAGIEQLPACAPATPGVLILDAAMRLRSATPATARWLEGLPGASFARSRGYLPQTVYAVAARAAATGSGDAGDLPSLLRVRTADARWVVIEGAPLIGADTGATAITVRTATRDEVLGLVCRACALTAREREILRLVQAGLDTRAIAERMSIARNTVQDHLKAIFAKVGVRSRRELLTG